MLIENKEDCIEKLKQTGNAISSLKNEILQITDYESFMLLRNKFSNYFEQFNSSLKELLDSIIFINEKNKEYQETIQRYENELKDNIKNTVETENNFNELNLNKRMDSLSNNDRYAYTKQNEEITKKLNKNNINNIQLHYNYDLLDPNDYLGYPPFEPKRKNNYNTISYDNKNNNNSKNIIEKEEESQNLLSSISKNNNSTYIVPNEMNMSLLNKINENNNKNDNNDNIDNVNNNNNNDLNNKNIPKIKNIEDEKLPENSVEKSKNKVDRIQKIITSAYKSDEILKGLNEKFGDNFLEKITSNGIKLIKYVFNLDKYYSIYLPLEGVGPSPYYFRVEYNDTNNEKTYMSLEINDLLSLTLSAPGCIKSNKHLYLGPGIYAEFMDEETKNDIMKFIELTKEYLEDKEAQLIEP